VSELMADESAWRARGRAMRTAYLGAKPWPHVILGGVFPPELVAEAERQELQRDLGVLIQHRSHREIKGESPTDVSSASQCLLQAMCTPSFLGFLEEMTAIKGLVPDPIHLWSGLHISGRGSFQSVHRDFARHPITGKWHKLNVLLYLNSGWQPSFGGFLELWPREMDICNVRVLPTAGKMVIFETCYDTLHGVPDPVTCPPDRYRLSLASYYYNDEAWAGKTREPLFRQPRRPQDSWQIGIMESRHIILKFVRPLYNWLWRHGMMVSSAGRSAIPKSRPPACP
jgi:hypothetical protein